MFFESFPTADDDCEFNIGFSHKLDKHKEELKLNTDDDVLMKLNSAALMLRALKDTI